MARKIIKGVLFILAAVVVAGGIMTYVNSKKNIQPQRGTAEQQKTSETQTQAPTSQVQQIIVSSEGSNARVQINGVSGQYDIERMGNEGFKIQIPRTQIAQVERLMSKPHPLINKIEVHEKSDNPSTAELVFYTAKNVNFLDSQKDGGITIDFVQTQPEVAAPVTKASPSKKTAAAKSKAGKKKALASKKKSKRKSSGGFNPLTPVMSDDAGSVPSDIPQEGSSDLSSIPQTESLPTEDSSGSDLGTPPAKEESDGFDLKDLAKSDDAPKGTGNSNLLDAETEMSLKENTGSAPQQKLAMRENQKVDVNQLQANLPALQNLSVGRSGTSTLVTFERERAVPYKIFRMTNPSRIVVDFKDIKSNLQSDYAAFSGTKIKKIETRQFAGGADGMLVRVILYVDGAPNYLTSKKNNQLIVEIQ